MNKKMRIDTILRIKTGTILTVFAILGPLFFAPIAVYSDTVFDQCVKHCGGAGCFDDGVPPSGYNTEVALQRIGDKYAICTQFVGASNCARCKTVEGFDVNPLASRNVPELAGNIIRVVLGIIGTIALIIFIYGGFVWMTSMGEEDRIKRGRETMIWAGLGLIAIFGAYTVVEFIISNLV